MPPVKAVATIPAKSGLARDAFSNTFAFATNTDDNAGLQAVADAVTDFYTALRSNGRAIVDDFSDVVSNAANAARVDLYDLTGHQDGTPTGSPIWTKTWTVPDTQGTAAGLPAEMCAVISYSAAGSLNAPVEGGLQAIPTPRSAVRMGAPVTHQGTIRPRQRLRGRLYIGPLRQASVAADSQGEVQLTGEVMATLSQAALALINLASAEWQQWSRREALMLPVTAAWVDNEPDVQRRRGRRSSAKTSVGVLT